jgi:hypothetical protein
MNAILIDIDTLETELKAQELFLSEAEWNAILASIKRAELTYM